MRAPRQDRREAQGERGLESVQIAGKEIAPQLVRAERVVPGGRQQPCGCVLRDRVVPGDYGGRDGRDCDDEQAAHGDGALRVAEQPPHSIRPDRPGLVRSEGRQLFPAGGGGAHRTLTLGSTNP